MTYAEQVREIISLLSVPGRWGKDHYFHSDGSVLCCCVHGAAQVVSNPVVTDLWNAALEGGKLRHEATARAASGASSGAYTAAARALLEPSNNYCLTWQKREEWLRLRFNLHYLLGMFGITARFNDERWITLQDVLSRLEECAAWAADHEEFLRNN